MTDIAIHSKNLIEGFINERVTGQGLDSRTEKAYRMDLELFYMWLRQKESQMSADKSTVGRESVSKTLACGVIGGGSGVSFEENPEKDGWEEWAESYLAYLAKEKKLRSSTISRKNKVITYYLSYLEKQGVISSYHPPTRTIRKRKTGKKKECGLLSRKDADAFFEAMNKEYENLDSKFRKRVCLRDMVMMELLFCHKIEISELLRMQVQDYDAENGNLKIRRKREEESSVYLYSRELRRKMGLWLNEREHFKRDGEYEEIMFLSKFGKPLSMEMMVKIFDKYRELAGISEEFTPRDLKEGVMKSYARELVMERYGL